jgi:asparagine synthase (glutamine-hydrolysing)
MCGIVGGKVGEAFDRGLVSKALDSLAHRGPDGQAVQWLPENLFLGHTRLAIVGGALGQQPLHNEDRTIWAVVNGEFYDYRVIRDQLQAQGHVFATQSDSELLIHLYEEFDTECLKFLHGEFAFALYDTRIKRWFCARDRFGVRPLQYVHRARDFLFASEAKALLACGVPAQLNREALFFSQHVQYLPADETLFQGIRMVKPAHYLLVGEQGLSEHAYWSLHDVKTRPMSAGEAMEQARTLLAEAVERRIPDEVKWATHLSGGLDSSLVSILSMAGRSDGQCFTVKFTDDGFYDETPFARATADSIGAKLIEVPVSYESMLKVMPQAVYHAEGLSINGHLGAKYLLNQAIREDGCKVALTGEGADEIFMGYSHLKQDYLDANALTAMEQTYLAGVQLPSGETLDLSAVKERLGFVPTWLAAKASMAHKLKPFWSADFARTGGAPYVRVLEACPEGIHAESPLKTASALWTRYCLSGYILKVLDDAQAMAHSIEGRLPFLDTKLVEFMWSVPDELHFRDSIEKSLLRQGFADCLPKAVREKTKQSFMSPPLHRAMVQPRLKALMSGVLLDSPRFAAQGLFEPARLEAFIKLCSEQDHPSHEPILMTLMSIALFCEAFLA